MKYHTETERIANEAFDRAMSESTLPHAKFYVNGVEWNPTEDERILFDQFEQSALAQQAGQPRGIHVASEEEIPSPINAPVHSVWCACHLCGDWRERQIASRQEQEDFWAGLPREQAGIRRVPADWRRVGVYLALFGFTLGILGAIALGLRELFEVIR